MRLIELSEDYRRQALALRGRILELRAVRVHTDGGHALICLDERIKMLETMWREARELAVLTGRYYERGYRRNAKYTL